MSLTKATYSMISGAAANILDFGAVGDGTTDSYSAIQAALNSGAASVYVPDGTYLVSNTLNVPASTVFFGSSKTVAQIKLSSSAVNGTHVLNLQPFVTIRDLWIRGNWDLATTGQSGVGIYAKNLSVAMHGLTIENVQIDRCKSVGLYVYEGAYFRVYNLISDTHGLDAVSLEGASAGSFTTTEIGGMSTFSSCPNGYGLRLKNCHSSKYTFVSEFTLGVAFEGNHRALLFDSCYFETPASVTQDHIYNTLSGGAFGLTIQNNFLGMIVQTSVIQGDANYQYCLLINNNNLSTVPYLDANYKNWTVINAGEITKALGVNCIVDSKFTATGNVGTGEDILYTYDLPGNTLTTNGEGVRIRAWGKTAANANNKTLKLYFGSLLFNSGAIAVNDKDWVLDAVILRAGVNDQTASVSGIYNATAVIQSTTMTEVMANDITIKVTGEATATNDISIIGAFVEQLNGQDATF